MKTNIALLCCLATVALADENRGRFVPGPTGPAGAAGSGSTLSPLVATSPLTATGTEADGGTISMTAAGAGKSGYLTACGASECLDAGLVMLNGAPLQAGSSGMSSDAGINLVGGAASGATGNCVNFGPFANGWQICSPGGSTDLKFYAGGGSLFGTWNYGTGYFNAGVDASSLKINGTLVTSPTAPTIASGFGTSPSLATHNGTISFRITIGSGGSDSSGVLTLPTATAWNCFFSDLTTPGVNITKQNGVGSATSVTVTNYVSGVATAWTAADVVQGSCFGD